MSGNVLIVCNTHYQLLVAMQLKLTVLKDRIVDCVLSGSVSNVAVLHEKLRAKKLFRNVFRIQTKGINFGWNVNISSIGTVDINLINLIDKHDYTECFFANLGGFDRCLGRYLLKDGRKVSIAIYEDGLSSYSKIYGKEIETIKSAKNIVKNLITKNPFSCITAYYVFSPEIMTWPCSQVKRIPPIQENIAELREIANFIYSYDNLRDDYSEKVIFFEESYFQDGIAVDDVALVESLAEKYGMENIFIKTHPRNEVNRFKNMGYKTNIDKAVPWEVIALNLNLDDKVLVTMTSSAIANTCIMYPSKAQLIYDYRGMDLDSNTRLKYTVEVIQRMKIVFPELTIMED